MEQEREIVIGDSDYTRLRSLIDSYEALRRDDAENLRVLEQEMAEATVVDAGEIPDDVVAMNSRVTVKDLRDGRQLTYRLVYPEEADLARNRISVLAPIGTGLLGRAVGACLEWIVPSGVRRLLIMAVEQEADELRQRPQANAYQHAGTACAPVEHSY